jgi:shikimate kinase
MPVEDGASVAAQRRPIALAGFMGVGKSSVGRLVAAQLGRPFIDTDDVAQSITGRSILDCFQSGDEAVFREAEARAVRQAVASGAAVIALGGGAVQRDDSLELLLEKALLVYLHVPWSELREWLPEMAESRPLLQGRTIGEMHQLYRSRVSTYRRAHLRVWVRRTSPEEAARRVLRALQRSANVSSPPCLEGGAPGNPGLRYPPDPERLQQVPGE